MFLSASTAELGPVPPPAPTKPNLADPNSIDALAEALLHRLLPAVNSLVEDMAARVVSRTLQSLKQGGDGTMHQGETQLGLLQPGVPVTVDWAFANSGSDPWPASAKLRFLGGSLSPTPGQPPTSAAAPTSSGGTLAVQATMTPPPVSGPCDARWQLEADGVALSPPLLVQGLVGAGSCPTQHQEMSSSSSPTMVTAASPKPTRGLPVASGMPIPVASHTYAQAPAGDDWLRTFEDFFGREASTRVLQQGGSAEQNRMVNQVYEYMRKNNLSRSEGATLDDRLVRLFSPVLQPGQTTCKLPDLLFIIQSLNTKYVQRKRGS